MKIYKEIIIRIRNIKKLYLKRKFDLMHACIWVNYSIISDEILYDIIDMIPIWKNQCSYMHNTIVKKAKKL